MNTSMSWQYHELLKHFFDAYWEIDAAAHAAGLLLQHIREARNVVNSPHLHDDGWGFANVA